MQKVEIDRISDVVSGRANVLAAWLFGSAQGGQVRPGADIDVAVVFRTAPGLDELTELRADLQEALAFEEIDLVVLNDASAVLRFEAASGRLLHSACAESVAGFVSLAAREYEDEMALMQRHLGSR